MQTITMFNDYVMVKELVTDASDTKDTSGLFIPEDVLEDEQVAQGIVVRSNSDSVVVGDTLLFHKVMPVDVNMKIDSDTGLAKYFFIRVVDIICKIN